MKLKQEIKVRYFPERMEKTCLTTQFPICKNEAVLIKEICYYE